MGQFFFKVSVFIRTCVPHLGALRRERSLTIDNPLNPPGVGQKKFMVRESIRTGVQNLGAVRRKRFLTIDNTPGVGVGQIVFFYGETLSAHACQIWARCGLTAVSKKGSLKFVHVRPSVRTHERTTSNNPLNPQFFF